MLSLRKNRKGQVEHVLFYALVYLPLTAIVVFFITKYMPFLVFGDAASSFDAEKLIYTERVFSSISKTDEVTLRRQSFIADLDRITDASLERVFYTEKPPAQEANEAEKSDDASRGTVGIRVTASNKKAYFDKGFFDDAFPLKPRYATFVEKRAALLYNPEKAEYSAGIVEVAAAFNPRYEQEVEK